MQSFLHLLLLLAASVSTAASAIIQVDGETGAGASARRIMRKAANQGQSIEISGGASMHDDLNKEIHVEEARRTSWFFGDLHWQLAGAGEICASHYLVESANNMSDCAKRCDAVSGCNVFSYGLETGCRVSACGHPHAINETGDCGSSSDLSYTQPGQCGTHQVHHGDKLYKISIYEQIGVNKRCGTHFVRHDNAQSATMCLDICLIQTGCHVFSYGADGCRLSACRDPHAESIDPPHCTNYNHFYDHDITDQCGEEDSDGDYMYVMDK
jgi:hypothetical protein